MDEPQFQHLLIDTTTELTNRVRSLPATLQVLHQRILKHFATTGQPADPQLIARWTAELGVDTGAALNALTEADLIQTDGNRILGAYPFAATPSGHQVDIDDGPSVQSYCAIDALGIPALVGRDAVITARDPHSGSEIRVLVRGGQASWELPDAVVTVPTDAIVDIVKEGDDQPAADTVCPTINFYASAHHARAYEQAHHLSLTVLTIPQALQLATAAFGGLRVH